MSNKALTPVANFYKAVARLDVPGVLATLSDDLCWTEAEGFPYYSGTWRSPNEVLEKLLVPLTKDWDNFAADAEDFVVEGDRIVSFGAYSGTSKKTGKKMRAPFAHLWRVKDGKITHFTMYTDTLLVHRALQI